VEIEITENRVYQFNNLPAAAALRGPMLAIKTIFMKKA
jgi:hypothetical protein